MMLSDADALDRLAPSEFGVLGTVDASIGVHLVPVVFVVDGQSLLIPVDTVKPKGAVELRRIRNLGENPTATLLADHRSLDWERLWWVRAELRHRGVSEPTSKHLELLGMKYPAYRTAGSVAAVIELELGRVAGWAAAEPT